MVDELARQRSKLTSEIRAFNEVTRLRDKFPDSRTPGEACLQAGIDPKSFHLEEDLTG